MDFSRSLLPQCAHKTIPPAAEIAAGYTASFNVMNSLTFLGSTFTVADFNSLRDNDDFASSNVQTIGLLFFRSIIDDLQIMQKDWLRIQPYDDSNDDVNNKVKSPTRHLVAQDKTPASKHTKAEISAAVAARWAQLETQESSKKTVKRSRSPEVNSPSDNMKGNKRFTSSNSKIDDDDEGSDDDLDFDDKVSNKKFEPTDNGAKLQSTQFKKNNFTDSWDNHQCK